MSEPASMYSNGADMTSPTITAVTILIRLVTRGRSPSVHQTRQAAEDEKDAAMITIWRDRQPAA